MADDWEKEYEEDRKRMAGGGNIAVTGRRNVEKDDPFQEKAAYQPPQIQPVASKQAQPQAVSQAPSASAKNEESKMSNEESIASYYAQYSVSESGNGNTGGGGATAGGPVDARFGVPKIQIPRSLQPLFDQKFGEDLYFCETCIASFKGFFSPNEAPMTIFVTGNCFYLGDPQTGEVIICQSIKKLREVQNFGDSGVGIRSTQGVDLFLRMEAQRNELGTVLTKIAKAKDMPFQVRTLSADAEKAFRKDIRYVDRKEYTWDPEEDPRTGLMLVGVPDQHKEFYAPIVPKILHWFGGVNHITRDWKGAITPMRSGCWLTATSLFLSKPGGPQSDGRDITRCIGIEYMTELVDGPEGYLGVISKDGPPQPHLGLLFDSRELKNDMIYAIQKCFFYRKKAEIRKTKSENLEKSLKIEKEKDFKPQLFQMRTRQDLFGLMRGKTQT